MPVELEKMCRTCLAVDTAMLSIFDSHKSAAKDEKSSSLATMLNTFSAAAISETDGLPKQVCLPCISEINRVYLFKIKCDNSQNTLKKYLEKLSSTSDDVESDDDVIIVQDMKVDCDDEVLLFEAPIDVKEKESDLNTNGGEGIVQDNDILVRDEKTPERTDGQQFDTNQHFNDAGQSYETNQHYNEQPPNCTKNNLITAESSQVKDSLKCPLCLTSFTDKRSFLRHVLGRHSTDLPVTLVEAILCNMNDDETGNIQPQPETEFLEENFEQLVSVNYNMEPDEFTDITEYDRREQYSFDEITGENASQTGVFACYVCSQKFETNYECDIHSQLCHENRKDQIAWTSYEYRLEIDSGAMDKEEEDSSEQEKNYSKNENNVDEPKIGQLTNDNLKVDLNVSQDKSATSPKSASSFIVKLDKNLRKKLECTFCKKIFISAQSLALHLDSHEKTSNNQKRTIKNDQQAEQKENMETRSVKQNNVAPKKQCPICKKEFQKIHSLKCHILTHNAKGPLECPVCGKCLSSRRNRNNHLILHATAGFKCGRCRRSFISEKELSLHLTKHAGMTKYVCTTCGCIFTNRKVFTKHNQIHKKETPHVCKFCSMRFKALGSLTVHLRTHVGEKPYRCQHCDRGFARNFDRMKHMKTHTQKHPDICSVCGLSFSEPDAILKHFETSHPGMVQVSPKKDNEHSKAGQT